MSTPQEIHSALVQISEFIMPYASTLAALGVLTVALLEAWKKVFSTLPRFHRKALCRWLDYEKPPPGSSTQLQSTLAAGQYGLFNREKPDGYDARKAYAQLLHLTTGLPLQADGINLDQKGSNMARNITFALFELEVAKMMAQVQEAADAALNNPQRYEHWFAFVTRGCNPEDIADWRRVLAGNADQPTREKGAAAYGRIRLLVRRQLDGFQTITAYRWREWNQWWAWLVGGILMMAAQLIQAPEGKRLDNFVLMLIVSLAGGILAPVAKDLVDALAKVKTGG